MADTEKLKKGLEEVVKEVLDKMGVTGSVSLVTDAFAENKSISVEIQSEDSSYLIGKFGINLNALQHICRIIAKRKLGEEIFFSIDVNNYRQKQTQNIIEMANSAISEALEKNKPITLRPMNAFERRLVHVQVAENGKVESESIGEYEERRVIIKPKEEF